MPGRGFVVRTAGLLMVLQLIPFAVADDTAAEVRIWLDRMGRAVETLNYHGTLVHWRDGQVDTLRIIHRADENGIRERIYSLDGPPREILRDGDQVRCLLAGDQPLVVQSQLTARLMPNLPVSRLGSLESAYSMAMGDRERVAGMMTQMVEIKPLDEFRYGHRLWLEERTGMLLRSALMDHRGRALQQLSFVSIELGVPISDAELEPSISQHVAQETNLPGALLSSRSADPRRASWVPPRVPDHFKLAKVGRGSGHDGSDFEHLVFSDGLASFSVYVEAGKAGYSGGRVESMGPVHVYTGLQDGRQITVVGEVPLETVQYIGRSMRRMPGARNRN
jgi:sigma-E factor negative regulatory protein RseB